MIFTVRMEDIQRRLWEYWLHATRMESPKQKSFITATQLVEKLDSGLWVTFWTIIIILFILLSADLYHGRNGNLKPYRRKLVRKKKNVQNKI